MSEKRFDMSSLNDIHYACTAIFARKWQLSIIIYLFSGPKHFGEILRFHKEMSKKVLSTNLYKLEYKGIIKKTVYAEGAVTRVEYSLTDKGRELQPILQAMSEWGALYAPRNPEAEIEEDE